MWRWLVCIYYTYREYKYLHDVRFNLTLAVKCAPYVFRHHNSAIINFIIFTFLLSFTLYPYRGCQRMERQTVHSHKFFMPSVGSSFHLLFMRPFSSTFDIVFSKVNRGLPFKSFMPFFHHSFFQHAQTNWARSS